MAKGKVTVEVIPSARRLIHSLRDIGYDFVHAVADLVDNSIAANASEVAIDMRFAAEDSWLRIADNGTGMSGTVITEAMRFGCEREYDADELGRFGLGLKTASLSQCSCLTVASRTDANTKRIEVRQWDLEHVERTNKWQIISIPPDERPDTLVKPLRERRGTVVLWENLDRVLGYKIPWGDHAKNGFLRLAEQLDQHLAMVFHRFLSGEAKRKKGFKISLNGMPIEPWDPFARDEKATVKMPAKQFEIAADKGVGLVGYTPYVLPPQNQFSSLRAFERYAGPAKWNYQQGFYIYRADRMIQSGGWCHMRTSDEHTKLARIALDFWPDLDSAFELNVAKARVNLPADVRIKLKLNIEQLAKHARDVYSGSGSRVPKTSTSPKGNTPQPAPISSSDVTEPSTQSVENVGPGVEHAGMPDPAVAVSPAEPSGDKNGRIGQAMERAATKAGELTALNKIKQVLRQDSPAIAAAIGW